MKDLLTYAAAISLVALAGIFLFSRGGGAISEPPGHATQWAAGLQDGEVIKRPILLYYGGDW